MTELTDFELPNVTVGPDPFGLLDYAADPDRKAIVLLFLRDYHCPKCRTQVETLAGRYDEFEARDAAVVAVLPEPTDRTRTWADQSEIPFPLLADGSKTAANQYDQPTRFGALGGLHDMIGRMPEAVVIDATGAKPTVDYTHRGDSPGDRPTVDDLLDRIDEFASVEA
jgi:peroxiredoxin Q/BCP